jgi:hypothetical protein
MPWEIAIPKGSPTPTYNPSRLQISTSAFDALVTASTGGDSVRGTLPTPMPTQAWTGTEAAREHAFVKVAVRAMFQGRERFATMLVVGPNIVTPAFSASSTCW